MSVQALSQAQIHNGLGMSYELGLKKNHENLSLEVVP